MKRLISVIAFALVATALVVATAPAANSSTVGLRSVGKLGKVVVNAKGHTLYLFEKDKHGKSACSGACAVVWAPVVVTGKPTAGAGLKKSLLGTTKRSDGKTQVTYHGHPLYTYDDDKKVGTAKGQGSKEFGASWYVVNASGNKVDKS
jgi:predicted lipoprotein with Yx(FWY)xxD motif